MSDFLFGLYEDIEAERPKRPANPIRHEQVEQASSDAAALLAQQPEYNLQGALVVKHYGNRTWQLLLDNKLVGVFLYRKGATACAELIRFYQRALARCTGELKPAA